MKTSFILFFSLFIFLNNASGKPLRVMIIRHAEKPADKNDPHLSPEGYKRAQALTSLFDIHPEYLSKGNINNIFASKYVPGKNAVRAIETITPLAETLGLPVEIPYRGPESKDLAKMILKNPQYNGKVILISWVHGDIPILAKALGKQCDNQWRGSVFDRVWILDYSGSKVSCTDVPESVMPGDSE